MFAEFPITLADPTVWLSIGQGLLVGAVCLLFGVWVARVVGLLPSDAPAGETLGVGLASGLLVLVSWWAAIGSGGRSSFTPVAVGFAIAIGLAAVRRTRARGDRDDGHAGPPPGRARRADLVVAILGGAVFVVAVALLYGSTLVLSPRDGVQPLEFQDGAFYSVLGKDLAETGTETIYSPSGFTDIVGPSDQTWYHWGEMWLASAVIKIFGMAPLDARHLVVLPLLLLAAANMTGTIVRRITGLESPGAFLFGFLACLFLAPVPFVPGPPFNAWAVGMLFGITAYGLAAVATLLGLYCLAMLGRRPATWALAAFVGSAAAMIVPAHVVIGLLVLVGLGSVWTVRIAQSLAGKRPLPDMSTVWRRTFAATAIAIVATVTWGLFTGHGLGGSGLSPNVDPFNASWRESVAIVAIGGGALLAIAVAGLMVRRERSIEAELYLGIGALLVVGALVWGARLGDFNMFHVFFAGIAVFAVPAAAVAVLSIWIRLRATGHRRMAIALVVLCVAQLEFGVLFGVARLEGFGPGTYAPVRLEVLAALRDLPADAKLAYACEPPEEGAFWNPALIGLDAHTGRRVVPMCFQPESLARMTGTQVSADVPSPLFEWAPQRALYPTSGARPTTEAVLAFLKANDIEYIYVDAMHPNTLIPDATPILTNGETQLLRIP